jgi:hypothetical protein
MNCCWRQNIEITSAKLTFCCDTEHWQHEGDMTNHFTTNDLAETVVLVL